MLRRRPDARRAATDRAWRSFELWCARHRLRALPAHPWVVAAYLRWCEHRHVARRIDRELAAIARVHVLSCESPPDRHPTVVRTLRAIAMRQEVRAASASLFEPVTEVAAAKKQVSAERPRRSLRMTPRLVSRRGKSHP